MDQDFDQIDRAYDANEADVESGYIFLIKNLGPCKVWWL